MRARRRRRASWTRRPSSSRYAATTSRTIGSSSTTSTSGGRRRGHRSRAYDRLTPSRRGGAARVSRSLQLVDRCDGVVVPAGHACASVAIGSGRCRPTAAIDRRRRRARRCRRRRRGARRRRAGRRRSPARSVAGDGRRHRVHRPLRRLAEGSRRRAVRHQRQAGAGRRDRGRRRCSSAPCSVVARPPLVAIGAVGFVAFGCLGVWALRDATRWARRRPPSSAPWSPSPPASPRFALLLRVSPATGAAPQPDGGPAPADGRRRSSLGARRASSSAPPRRRVLGAAAAGPGRRRRQRGARTVLPRPVTRARRRRPTSRSRVAGLAPYVTPNDDFYRIDTALSTPQVDVGRLAARHHGHGRSAVLAHLRRAAGASTASRRRSRCSACPTRSAGTSSATPCGRACRWRRCSIGPACRPARRRSSGGRSTAGRPASRPSWRRTGASPSSPTR